ncbi:MAG: OmpA family protein [Pseudomonadales bacterium]|nr:OmpA family protein [Pseudomonadales bacterium]
MRGSKGMVLGMATLALFLSGCVSKSTYDKAVADLAGCRQQLQTCQQDQRTALDQAEVLRAQEQRLRTSLEAQAKIQAVEIEQLQGRLLLRVLDKVLFNSGSAEILADGRKVLDQLLASLQDTQFDILVEGHTDNVAIGARLRSRYASNWELSCNRATSVIAYLERTGGIAPARMAAMCHSKYRPVGANASAADRQQNRRVTIVLTPAGSFKR